MTTTSRYPMRMRGAGAVSALALVLCSTASAQGYPTIVRPLPAAAIAESIAVLRRLDTAVMANPNDAAAWYHRAMVAWLLAEQDRQGVALPGMPNLGIKLMADTSFKLALELDRENPRYLLTMGQYRLGRGFLSLQRFQAYRFFELALDQARAGGDRGLHAETAIELGRVHWRRYDAIANRRFETQPNVVLSSLESMMQPDAGAMRLSYQTVLHQVHQLTQQIEENGDVDYYQAENYFREAYRAAPDDPRTFRQLAMLLAERDRWPELIGFANERIASHRSDAWGWMSLGLALRRRGELVSAEAVFDSAIARLDRAERTRLYRPELVMTQQEATRFAKLTGADRQAVEATFWRFADPLWSRDGNDARTEFLARMTYADLRWTVEEFGVYGIDSDRGAIHVRYGPADTKMQIWPQPGADGIGELAERGSRTRSDRIEIDELTKFSSYTPVDDFDRGFNSGLVTTIWAYENGMLFFFRGNPTYAIARIPGEDRQHVDTLISVQPARWANVAGVSVEDMPTVITRFRHGTDSASITVGVDAPVARIRAETVPNARVRGEFWLMHPDLQIAFHDTGWLARDTHGWVRTVPAGRWAYRAEVTSDAANVAGRSGDWVVAGPEESGGFALRGFGMSDVMLGTSGEPRGVPRRWYDVDIAPGGGTIPLNGDIALLWENYEFGNADGNARYDVTLTLQREYALLVSRVRARIVGGAATLLGIDRVEGRIVIRFERDVAHAPVLVDHVILSMDGVPAGFYKVTIDVTDRVSGRSTSRVTGVTVRE